MNNLFVQTTTRLGMIFFLVVHLGSMAKEFYLLKSVEPWFFCHIAIPSSGSHS